MLGPYTDVSARFLADTSNGASGQYWIVVAFAMLVGSYLLMRPKKRKDPLDKPVRSSLAQERGVERQMQSLLVELTQMAQQISAQLDTRSAKLEALIKEADEKIKELAEMGSAKPQAVHQESFEDERYLDIYTMADHGAAAREIAQKLNRPMGEVELILALRSSKAGVNTGDK